MTIILQEFTVSSHYLPKETLYFTCLRRLGTKGKTPGTDPCPKRLLFETRGAAGSTGTQRFVRSARSYPALLSVSGAGLILAACRVQVFRQNPTQYCCPQYTTFSANCKGKRASDRHFRYFFAHYSSKSPSTWRKCRSRAAPEAHRVCKKEQETPRGVSCNAVTWNMRGRGRSRSGRGCSCHPG